MLKLYSRRSVVPTTSVAALCILLLAGCASRDLTVDADASAGPSASPSAAPTASSSDTPTPVETPAPLDLADPGSWVIDFTTLGPLTRGTPASEVGTSMDAFTATVNEGCPWITEYDRPDFPSIWLIASPDSDVISEVVLRAAAGNPSATGSSATGASPGTREGIVVGSTLGELTAAYPALQEIEGPPGEPSYAVTDGGGNYIDFAVSDEGVVQAIILRDQPGVPQEYCS